MAVAIAAGGTLAAPAEADPAGGVRVLVLAILLGLALPVGAPERALAAAGEACRDQAAIAERAAGVPEGLLLAIGKQESGRFDSQTGGVLPWPWAVNREGEGHLFGTRDEAIAYVAAAQRQGSRSIDVGCFQINLKYHPIAFASLDEAFDPARNAAYAARFLTVLHDREGSWETAVADYHSGTPLLGVPYREAVLATWRGAPGGRIRSPALMAVLEPVRVVMGIRIWTSGAASFSSVAGATYVIPAAYTVPAGLRRWGRGPAGVGPADMAPAGHPVRDLPRVITPLTAVEAMPAGGRRSGTRLIADRRRE